MILVAARTGWEAENKGKEKVDEGGEMTGYWIFVVDKWAVSCAMIWMRMISQPLQCFPWLSNDRRTLSLML